MCRNQSPGKEGEVLQGEGNGAGDTQPAGGERRPLTMQERGVVGTPDERYWQTTTRDDAISLTDTIYNKIVAFSLQ